MKKEKDEIVADEMKESPAIQKKEAQEGTEEHIIPEDFQRQVHSLLSKAPKHHLEHIRNRLNAREDEMRKEEDKKMKQGLSKAPSKFSVEDMPS